MTLSKRHLLTQLKRHMLECGVSLRVRLWDGTEEIVGRNPAVGLTLTRPRAARHFLNPDLGRLGMAYVEGDIDFTGPVAEVVRIAERLSAQGTRHWASNLLRWSPLRHSLKRDERAIAYHYDVSNDFYRLWLDRNMVYSCAYFRTGREDIHTAQMQKLDHICRKLQLSAGDRFLDIGCGWGALICWAAKHYGVRATGVTLSDQQHRYCVEQIRTEGLSGQVEVRLQDYRHIPGEEVFDKIASVGMFEHVGIRHFAVYFGTIHRLLRDGGLVLNHGITTRDTGNATVRAGGSEFMDRYVFPDGELPYLSVAIAEMEQQNLEVFDAEGLRPHYAQTLMHWVTRLEGNQERAIAIAGERQYRIWRIYMAGCVRAFERGWVSVYQLLAAKQVGAGSSPQPWTREYMSDASVDAEPARLRWPGTSSSESGELVRNGVRAAD